MSDFNEQLARMKGLMNYGKVNEEASPRNNYTLEFHKTAADGKTYGIIRECNKYYIKCAETGKELVAESYNYIGGFNNKKDYEYYSYANALKQFELKMSSINEACEGNVKVDTLDPFRSNAVLVEGTDKMKNEIARQRQIMYNASMLMNESTTIGASRKGDTVMFDGANPEAEDGKKGDEGYVKTSATLDKDLKKKTNGVDKTAAPFEKAPGKCADQLKEDCCCDGECTCDKEDWGSVGIGKGREPKEIGWDIDGQTRVDEEVDEDMFNAGLPSEAGIGDAREYEEWVEGSKTVNEEHEEDDEELLLGDEENDDLEDEEDEDDLDLDFDEEGEDEEEDFDFGGEDEVDETDPEAIQSEIERLQGILDDLRDEDGEEDIELDDEPEESEEEIEVSEEEPEGETDFDDDMDECGALNEDWLDAVQEFEHEHRKDLDREAGRVRDHSYDDDDSYSSSYGHAHDNYRSSDGLFEEKQMYMDSIVESVVNTIKEENLNVFGKHPGYRKKPMDLPVTGEDKNQWGEDWNDESVYSEEPFGSKIGDGAPFEDVVDKVAAKIMETLKKK